MSYGVRIGIETGHEASDNFDIQDMDYYWGETRKRPPDFNLHLALYIFQREQLPQDMLENLRQWSNENRMAGVNYERLLIK